MAEEKTKQELIHDKGFALGSMRDLEFNKMKVGPKTLEDVVLDLGVLKEGNKTYANKAQIIKALADKDAVTLRAISNYFYRTSGIYSRVCNYFATLYRFDWYLVPEVYDKSVKEEKVLEEFRKILTYLDNSYVKKVCADIALNVIVNGAYYGCIVEGGDGIILQELPIQYCRVRYYVGNLPVIEFNMRFFDEKFPDTQYRLRVLDMFPKDFKKGYMLYKQGKLVPDGTILADDGHAVGNRWGNRYMSGGWYALEPGSAVKFSMTGNGVGCSGDDIPLFINAVPSILDLDAAQDLDRRKMMQKLLKIIVQKLPTDKNGDLIFDVDEAKDIHNTAVQMLSRAVGVDVLTTFADVDSIDMSDRTTSTSTDELEKVERTVYNSLGVSKNLFNTDGNLSLEKSILDDEGQMRGLLLQFNSLFDRLVQRKSTKKNKYNFRLYMLETTQYNYKELSKMYKEQVQIGYSKMLPQIALGHSQSSILNMAYFENEVLHLSEVMIPPLMSSVMSSEQVLGNKGQNNNGNSQTKVEGGSSTTKGTTKVVATETKKAGRPEKAEGQKSEKTIQNEESKS